MFGQFYRQTKEIVDETASNHWIKDGHLMKETEGLLMAAQEQAIRTRKIRHAIDKTDICPKCRWCAEKDETVEHLLTGCSTLAKGEYSSHNQVATVIHWRLCKKYGIQVHPTCYRHEVQPVLETES